MANSSFLDDIEETKMSDKVKLSIASAGFARLEAENNEIDLSKERDRSMDILQQLLPEANLNMKSKPVKEFKAVARFDPLAQTSAQLEMKTENKTTIPPGKHSKNLKTQEMAQGKKLRDTHEMVISKGVDKKKALIEKANQILKKSVDIYAKSSTKPQNAHLAQEKAESKDSKKTAKKRKVIKEIKTQKWKEISAQKAELKEFKLFG